MERKEVIKFLSKKILSNQLQAHINTKQDLLVLDVSSTDMNELQQLSLQYANHIQHMVQQNERLLEVMHIKTGAQTQPQANGKEKGKKAAAPGQPVDPGEGDGK